MSKQHTARGALASVLGMVSTTAGSITALVETGGDSIGMLNSYVSAAATKQKLNIDIDIATHEDTAFNNAAIEQTKAQQELIKFFREDPVNEKLFTANHNSLRAKVSAIRGEQYNLPEAA